jgi:hypothetical protein
VDDFSNEPAIKDRVTIEARIGLKAVVDTATIANLTPDEVWIVVDAPAADHLEAGCSVRIVDATPQAMCLSAETTVKRRVGRSDRMIALSRPAKWTTHSRRTNSRLRLAIPAYLRPDSDATVASAQTTNISVGGFHCVTGLPLCVGDQLSVSLMLTPTEAFECRAQVVRLSDNPNDTMHLRVVAALRFVDLTPADECRVAEALTALSSETDATAGPVAWHHAEVAGGSVG